MNYKDIRNELRNLADPDTARQSRHFFKTGKGDYGEGDKFLGIRVPELRKRVKQCTEITVGDVSRLLKSKYHEERLFALLLFVHKFSKGTSKEKTTIYKAYFRNMAYVNNWDLVDSSAFQIVGAYLENKDRQPIYTLAKSNILWERRIAIMSTFHFIRKHDYDDTINISEMLIDDKDDLIHKAVGWMLREVGNRDQVIEEEFLKKHYKNMPRTMLRYAIEKFQEKRRKQYLNNLI
jgi:3-methyladenine DNA glycosylase AlkD